MLFSALFIYQYPPVNSFSMLRTSTVMYFLPIVSGSSTVNDRDIDGLSKKKNKKKNKSKNKKKSQPKTKSAVHSKASHYTSIPVFLFSVTSPP